MGRALILTSLLLLAIGAAPQVAAAGARNSEFDLASVEANVVDCSKSPGLLICEFLRQAPLVPYAGPKAAVAHCMDLQGAGGELVGVKGWVLDRPTAQPLLPTSACTEAAKCERAADSVCKAAGKGGVSSGSGKIVKDTSSGDSTCQAKCTSNDSVYVVCLGGS